MWWRLAASGIFYGVFVGQLRQASQGPVRQKIVVAVRQLDRGAVLKPADLKLTPWAGAAPPGSFHKIEEASGKTVYGSIDENEPVTESRIGDNQGGGGIGIAKGMRALSIHVVDSSGLMPFLRAGNHVDVQVVKGRNTNEANLRTILQNVEVLSVQAQEPTANQAFPATITLLASPANADRVALADSGANIRLLLRNPLDDEQGARAGMMLASLFSDSATFTAGSLRAPHLIRTSEKSTPVESAAPAPLENVELTVRVGGASAHGLEDILAGIPGVQAGHSMQIIPLAKEKDGQRFWEALEQKYQLQPLSQSKLTAPNQRESRLQAGKSLQSASGPGGLCVRFHPHIGPDHVLHLRVQPEVSLPDGDSGLRIRKMVADLTLADGQSIVLTGLSEPGEIPALADRLFGNGKPRPAGTELVVLVTPHVLAPQTTIAAAGR